VLAIAFARTKRVEIDRLATVSHPGPREKGEQCSSGGDAEDPSRFASVDMAPMKLGDGTGSARFVGAQEGCQSGALELRGSFGREELQRNASS
jgi:hypothetical protein